MPQEFHVLRCFSCGTFQVHIVKKSNKWCCKMCGENQSVKKIYSQGSGKDCRKHVQSLNEQRMINDLNQNENICNEPDNDNEEAEFCVSTTPAFEPNSSKWREYLTVEDIPESESDTSVPYTFEKPNKRRQSEKKKRQQPTKSKENDYYENVESSEKKFKSCNYEDPEKRLISKYNSDDSNIESSTVTDVQTKQQLSENQSKWSSFLTESEYDSANFINPSSASNNIFNSTDINSLDDILDL